MKPACKICKWHKDPEGVKDAPDDWITKTVWCLWDPKTQPKDLDDFCHHFWPEEKP